MGQMFFFVKTKFMVQYLLISSNFFSEVGFLVLIWILEDIDVHERPHTMKRG